MASRRRWVDLDDVDMTNNFVDTEVFLKNTYKDIDWSNIVPADTSTASQTVLNTQSEQTTKDVAHAKTTHPSPSFKPGEPENGNRLPAYNPDPDFFIIIPPPHCRFVLPSIFVTPPEESESSSSETVDNYGRHGEKASQVMLNEV